MSKFGGKTFMVKPSDLANFGRDLGKASAKVDALMQKRMQQATHLVYRIAHQRRPYISKEEQKRGFRTKQGNVHHNRVSDPNAQLGVPVDTGNLQRSIMEKVSRVKYGKYQGEVWVDLARAPYGMAMEYGTDTVHARPFMRPAVAYTREQIKALFKVQIKFLGG